MAQLSYDNRPSRYGPAPVNVPAPTLATTLGGFGGVPAAPGGGVGGMTFSGLGNAAPAAPPLLPPVISTSNMRPTQGPPMSAMGSVLGADPAVELAGGKSGFFGADGFNIGDVGTISDIIGSFGSIWGAIQTNKLAKEEMAFQKQAYQTNLTNSLASYNTALTDRTTARHAQNERSPAETAAYIEANRLRA